MSNKLTVKILHTSILEIRSARRHLKGFEKISSAHLVISKVKFNLLAWFLKLVSLYPRDIICLWDTPITAVPSIYLIHPHFWASPPLPPSSRSTLSPPFYLLCVPVMPQLKSQVLTTVSLYREFFRTVPNRVVSCHCVCIHVPLGLLSGLCDICSLEACYCTMHYKGLVEQTLLDTYPGSCVNAWLVPL